MTDKEKGVKIGRIVSALRTANTMLNESNPCRNGVFNEGDTFFSLAFMDGSKIDLIDKHLFG
jgi:hypothetical protein